MRKDLKIPFTAVAADILTGKPQYIKEGDLSNAIRASGAVPVACDPVKKKKTYFMDGANVMTVPVKAAQSLGAEKVIAVNLFSGYFTSRETPKKPTKYQSFKTSLDLMQFALCWENSSHSDIIIQPQLPDIPFSKFNKGKDAIKEGVIATKKVLKQFKQLTKRKFLFFKF